MKKQMYFILLSVIFFFCLKGQTVYAEETPLQVEDNWLTREVARQVKKSDVKALTQEDFEKITVIDMHDSKLELEYIPKEISRLKNLVRFRIWGQKITTIPNEIFTLNKLEYLGIEENQITEIPKAIGQLKNLKTLDFRYNKIDSTPKQLAELAKLENLYLNGNKLIEYPNEIFTLTNLKHLNLSNNNLSSIPKEITNLVNLTHLNLSNSNLSSIPKEITNLVNLTHLSLTQNNISEIPEFIGKLSKLYTLDLSFNHIKEIPVEISNLKELHNLNLRHNELSLFPRVLLQMPNINMLDLAYNKINKIPNDIHLLNNLTSLTFSGNLFTSIPNELWDIKNLQYLELDSNNLTTISEKLSNLKKLRHLNLENNSLTELPNAIGALPELKSLCLTKNKISKLPAIDNLSKLEYLELSENKLTKIPKNISKLTKLNTLYLNANQISNISETGGIHMVIGSQQIILPTKKVFINSTKLEIQNIISVSNSGIVITGAKYDKDTNSITWNIYKNTSNILSYDFYYNAKQNQTTISFSGTVIQPMEIVNEIPLTAISLKKSEINLQVGKSALNSVIYNPEDTIDDKAVTWTSSNKKIATVTSKGKITGVSSGSAIVTAQVGKFTATCKVIVKDNSKPTENKIYFTDDYESKTVTKEETIRIPIKLSTIKDYYALDSSIKYDKSKLQFLGYSIKENYKDCYADSSDVDTLRFILASKGKNYPIKTSDDPIIYLNFKCIAAGDANVTITSTTLANLDEEVAIKTDNLDKTTIHITESSKPSSPDINRDGKFSLIDLAIDAYYYGVDADETDKTKYDADIIPDGKIDDLDLMEITKNIINNK